MAKIKHIAIRTPDPEATANFYKKVFGMEEAGKAGSGFYLTDGYLNLAILQSKDEGAEGSARDAAGYAGIDHFGFLVEDTDEVCAALDEAGATPMIGRVTLNPAPSATAQSYYEIKYRGPDNQVIDITSSGWVGN